MSMQCSEKIRVSFSFSYIGTENPVSGNHTGTWLSMLFHSGIDKIRTRAFFTVAMKDLLKGADTHLVVRTGQNPATLEQSAHCFGPG